MGPFQVPSYLQVWSIMHPNRRCCLPVCKGGTFPKHVMMDKNLYRSMQHTHWWLHLQIHTNISVVVNYTLFFSFEGKKKEFFFRDRYHMVGLHMLMYIYRVILLQIIKYTVDSSITYVTWWYHSRSNGTRRPVDGYQECSHASFSDSSTSIYSFIHSFIHS